MEQTLKIFVEDFVYIGELIEEAIEYRVVPFYTYKWEYFTSGTSTWLEYHSGNAPSFTITSSYLMAA